MNGNGKDDSNDLQPWTDPELEARVVALVLGEASDFEREELERHLGEEPELRLFKERIEQVHGLMGAQSGAGDAAAGEKEVEDWKLPQERRAKLLEAISVPAKGGEKEGRGGGGRWAWFPTVLKVAAVLLVFGVVSQLMFPSFNRVIDSRESKQVAAAPATTAPARRLGLKDQLAAVVPAEEPALIPAEEDGNLDLSAGWTSARLDRESSSQFGYGFEPPTDKRTIGGRGFGGGGGGALINGLMAAAESEESSAVLPSLKPAPTAKKPVDKFKQTGHAGAGGRIDRVEAGETTTVDDIEVTAGATLNFGEGESVVVGGGFRDLQELPRSSGAIDGGKALKAATERKAIPSDGSALGRSMAGTIVVDTDAPFAPPAPGKKAELPKKALSEMEKKVDAATPRPRQLAGEERYDEALQKTEKARRSEVDSLGRREADLKKAESYDRLGDYDEAGARLKEVLQQEPSNEEARRGLETITKGKQWFFDTARDQTRSDFLRGADVGWELGAPRSNGSAEFSEDLATRFFEVPPHFIAEAAKNAQMSAADPFADHDGESDPLKGRRLTAKGVLEQAGIVFPPGSSVTYDPLASRLVVRNSADNLDLVDAYLAPLAAPAEPESEPDPAYETSAAEEPFSTFSLHVSDVSFKLAHAALARNEWPAPDTVRIEEFVNAFDYGDSSPGQGEAVACRVEQCAHPDLQQRNLLRVSLRTAAAGRGNATPLHLTLLLDKSGSMERPDRRETVVEAFRSLAQLLREGDEVTLISFARQPRLLAERLGVGRGEELVRLAAETPSEGGTNLEAALVLAMEKAREGYTDAAQNRIVLLTDGAANLGDADPERLAQYVNTLRHEGIAFDAAGIGADGLNDSILEALTRKGDGRYYLLDDPADAGPRFARQLAGAFRPAAKNVKVQVEFNPDRVGRYKLLGFEQHRLEKEDFRNDAVDAAELAAEEAGVAVYQVEPRPEGMGDLGSVSVRFLDVASGRMIERRWPISHDAVAPRFEMASPTLRIAGTAARFAAKLKGDPAGERASYPALANTISALPQTWRETPRLRQLQEMIRQARELAAP